MIYSLQVQGGNDKLLQVLELNQCFTLQVSICHFPLSACYLRIWEGGSVITAVTLKIHIIQIYSGLTSGRVLDGELLYTEILEVNLFVMPTQDTRYKIQDILLSFCAYNYTHIRQNIQEHNIHKYTIQTQKLQILYKLNCFAVPDKHIQKTHIKLFIQKEYKNIIYTRYKLNHYIMYKLNNFTMSNK